MITKRLKLDNADEAVAILGIQDSGLRRLERELKVDIFVRHEEDGSVDVTIRGTTSHADRALHVINSLKQQIAPAVGGKTAAAVPQEPFSNGVLFQSGRTVIKPRTERQKAYIEAIFSSDLVISVGPAGTGKTFLAVAAALRALELNMIDRIILTRPIVEAGEKLGFLPGDLYEKVNPYLRPLYDAFYNLLGPEKFHALRNDEILEIVPLAYMRGRTLENAFIILDEAQNTVPEQMKMFLTRMGVNSKIVVTGDITQIDLKEKSQSGLVQATEVLKNAPGVSFAHFTKEDVVRHPLVKHIIHAYENWDKARAKKGCA